MSLKIISEFLLQGFKLKMDDLGNIMIKRLTKSPVYAVNTSEENSLDHEILKLQNGLLEFEKQKKNIKTDNTANIAIVIDPPLFSSPAPINWIRGRVKSTTNNCAPKAPMNLKVDKETRSSEFGDMTPINAEYGTLIAV